MIAIFYCQGQPEMDEDEKVDKCDEVRLWEDGWRARYYQSKFGVDPADAPEFCLQVAHEYVIGLCWVLAYYYQVFIHSNFRFVSKNVLVLFFSISSRIRTYFKQLSVN